MLNNVQQCVVNALLARRIPFRYAEESVFGLGSRSFDGCFRAAWNRLGIVFLDCIVEPEVAAVDAVIEPILLTDSGPTETQLNREGN